MILKSGLLFITEIAAAPLIDKPTTLAELSFIMY